MSVTNLTCIWLPDIEDPTQRSFRQLVASLGLIMVMFFVAGPYAGLSLWTHNLVLPGIFAGVLGIGIGVVAALAAEAAYRNYVPNE